MVRVLYYAGIRQQVGTFETRVEGFSGTVAELLNHLKEQYGYEISPADSCEAGDADPFSLLMILINGRHIAHVGGLKAPVSDGDTVSVFPLVGGG